MSHPGVGGDSHMSDGDVRRKFLKDPQDVGLISRTGLPKWPETT